MENLKEAMLEITSDAADDIVSKLMKSDSAWSYESAEVSHFVRAVAERLTGYGHGSDYWDAGYNARDYSDDPEGSYIFEGMEMSDVKDGFGDRLLTEMDRSDLISIDGFDKLYELAQNKANFTGTKKEFETVLKLSSVFGIKAHEIVTRYDG